MQEQLAKTAEETKANFNAFERNDLKLREVCRMSLHFMSLISFIFFDLLNPSIRLKKFWALILY